MIHDKKKEEPVEEMTLADIVENEEDKKILEPVEVKAPVTAKSDKYIMGVADKDGVFIRKEADDNSSILYILKKGEYVIINHDLDTDKYYYVSIKSVIGYVLKSEISIA